MYSNKIAVAVKHKGKVLREHGETVTLPFGSEYSVFIRNLNSVKAAVSVFIDGTDVTDGAKLLLDPHASFELERFVSSGSLQAGNRFKFIERTAGIERHRGITAEDGLIRVEVQYEKPEPQQELYVKAYDKLLRSKSPTPTFSASCSAQGMQGTITSTTWLSSGPYPEPAVAQNATAQGVTAPGSISTQGFYNVVGPTLELQVTVLVLKLVGEVRTETGPAYVTQPVTVRTRTSCLMCGTSSKSSAKFCSECGASLQYTSTATRG